MLKFLYALILKHMGLILCYLEKAETPDKGLEAWLQVKMKN